jgi:hypothetical protein
VVGRLANRLQRRLMAQQNRSWEFDLEEGTLDPVRLPRIIMDPFQPLSFKQEQDTNFRDTVVTCSSTIPAPCADARSPWRPPAPTSSPARWSAAA